MKFTKLHIYGFGRFQDYQLQLSEEPVHTFLGDNEAGKSTIMAFIRCILFGFPTKQQSEVRYEPRLGGRYGGSVTLETEHFGEVTIERVGPKASGDVKVYFNDGSIGSEAELKLLFGEIDRTIYTGIYSFGLLDLQTVEQLHSEELNRFMYGVGISGRKSLLELEKKNDKSMQALYKPTGRKPIINKRLKKVAEVDEKVRSWRSKLSEHKQFVKEQEVLITKIAQISNEKKLLNETYRYYEKVQSIAPVVLEKKMYENRLQQLPSYEPFPEDGLHRLEKYKDHLILAEADVSDLEERLEQIKTDSHQLEVLEHLDELEESIAEVRETGKVYEAKREEKIVLKQQIQYEQQQFEILQEKLGNHQFDMASYETGFLAEQQLEKLIAEEAACKQQVELLQTQFENIKASLEEKEKHVERLKSELLDVATRQEYEKELANAPSQLERERTLQLIDDTVDQLTKQVNFLTPSTKSSQFKITVIITSLILFIAGLYLIFGEQLYIGFLLAIVGVFIPFAFFIQRNSSVKTMINELQKQKEHQLQRKQIIVAELESVDSTHYDVLSEMVKKDEQIQDELFLRELSLKEVQHSYENICKQLDQWELLNGKLQEKFKNWATTYRYPSHLNGTHYLKMFKLVEQLRQKWRELEHLKTKSMTIEKSMNDIEERVKRLCDRFSVNYEIKNHFHYVEKLSELLSKGRETEKLYQRLFEQQKEVVEKLKTAESKKHQMRLQIESLYKLANVTSEESFRQKAKSWRESQHIKEQLRVLKSQIFPIVKNEKEHIEIEREATNDREDLKEKLNQLENKINSYWEQEKELHERLAEVKFEKKELEEGSSYSTALHNFENEKGILKEEVRKWAFHRTVQLLIDEAKAVYEKERQPKVIQEATKLFSFMTNEEYHQIFAPIGEQRLFVEKNNGLKFEPNELSQGTREQLYLALRWALALVHSRETPFPIIIDDIFVNFDEKRRLQAIKLLKELSKKHQILFFTCHPFIAAEISTSWYKM